MREKRGKGETDKEREREMEKKQDGPKDFHFFLCQLPAVNLQLPFKAAWHVLKS